MRAKVAVLEEKGGGNIFNKRLCCGERRLPSSLSLTPSSLPPSLHLCVSMCVGVCASRLSQLRCCSPPPQMSWEEEGKRMYLARGKREEFGLACETNRRL